MRGTGEGQLSSARGDGRHREAPRAAMGGTGKGSRDPHGDGRHREGQQSSARGDGSHREGQFNGRQFDVARDGARRWHREVHLGGLICSSAGVGGAPRRLDLQLGGGEQVLGVEEENTSARGKELILHRFGRAGEKTYLLCVRGFQTHEFNGRFHVDHCIHGFTHELSSELPRQPTSARYSHMDIYIRGS